MKMILKHLLIFILLTQSFTFFSQCTGSEPILFLGNDTTVCQMNPRVLTAPAGYTYYNWSTGATSQSITVTTPGTYSVEVVLISTVNKVVNGNFESGNTGFTSGYILGSGNPGYGPLTNEGTYAVTTNPSLVHSLFTSYPFDHSVPGTKMFVANGAYVPGTVVWSQTVAVTPGQDYALSAWFMNVLTTVNVANLQFYINGVAIGNVFSTNTTGNIWEQFYNVWNSGGSSSAVLSIVNQNITGGGGNDFAMDDIFFSPICKKNDSITITLSPAPTQTFALVQPTPCSGIPNGSITVTSATAVSYSFDNGATWQASNVKTGLAAGNYTVLSKNSAGCTVSGVVNLTLTPSALAQTTAFVSPTSCVGPWNGSITITSALGTSFSFDGGTTWQASNTMTGLAAGAYTVMSKDAGGCTVSSTVTLATPISALSQTTSTVSPTSCTGPSNGSITITSALGVSFSFDGGTTWQVSNTLTAMAVGVYTVMSKDAGGCTVSSTVTLTSATSTLAQTTAFVNPSACSVTPDGSITITSVLGVSFSFDGGTTWQVSNVKTGLAAGNFTVMSKDANGCTVSSTLTLVATPSTLTQTTSSIDPTNCIGSGNGSITITCLSGVSYSFDGGTTWQASNVGSLLSAGSYVVMSKDAGGCTASSTVVLTSTASMITQTTAVVVPTNCTGVSNGSITITSALGISFSFDGGTTWQGSNVLNSVSTGNYTVMSKDVNGCTTSSIVAVVATPAVLTQTITSVSPTNCFGVSNGSITITTPNATQYSFDGGTTWGASNVLNNAAIASYVLMSQDAGGCSSSSNFSLVTGVVLPSITTSTVPPTSCTGPANGSITINSPTSTLFSFDNGTTWQASNTKGTLAAGSYIVMAKTALGCINASIVALTTSASLITQTTSFVNPTNCSGTPNGSITVTSALGTSFSFDGGTTWQASNVMNNMAAGNYVVMSKDINGCTASSFVTLVDSPNTVTQTITSVSPTNCTGVSNGSITITSVGGDQFSFDGGTTWQTTNVLPNAPVGVYTLMSQDAVGCSATSTLNLTDVLIVPALVTNTVTPTLCAGLADGEISVVSATATQYSFDNGATWQTSNVQTGLVAGTYTVMVQDALGCMNSLPVNLIGNNVVMTLNVSQDITICQNGTATLNALATGGTSFVYHWVDFSSTSASQTVVGNVPTAYYVVQAENQDGCLSPKDSILVTVLNPISATITAPQTVCPNQIVNLAVTNVLGGLAPYTYQWTNGVSLLGTSASINTSTLNTATYSVVVKDACESAVLPLSTVVTTIPFVIPDFQIDNVAMCEPGIFNLVNTMDPSQVASSIWEISNGDRFVNQNQITLNDIKAGVYDVMLTVTNTVGCVDSLSLQNAFKVNPNPIANFNYSPSIITSLDPTVHLTNWSTNGDSYVWNIESGSPSVSTNTNVTSQFPLDVEGSYTVQLIVESIDHCFDSIEKIITVIPQQLMYVPNSFTPNGDQFNPIWKPVVSGFDLKRGYEVIVFNRWGEVVWKSNDIHAGWDGFYKGEMVPNGVYSWAIVTKDTVTDKKFYFNGHVSVLK
jgi:gliding motility-associated-like protein